MIKRIAALIFIFGCTSVAWMILGATIFSRTDNFGSSLRGNVASTWGGEQSQTPPTACYDVASKRSTEVVLPDGSKTMREETVHTAIALPVEATDAKVALDLDYRRKGLLWYSTYKVAFDGTYRFRNPGAQDQDVTFALKFPAERAMYDDFVMTLNGEPLNVTNRNNSALATVRLPAGGTGNLRVTYRSQGLDTWRYSFGSDVTQVRNFKLIVTTNFKEIDFPENTLSATEKRETGNGWQLTWAYKSLLSGFQIAMPMPEKLQPGPLAGEISLFAPVSLFFFFFLMFIITTLRKIELHPMNYFFLAAAFFSFHLLLAYLVDHIALLPAFALCSAVSIFLVVSYLRLVVGMRFAALEAGLAQLIYLVLFSYAFFFKGYTGLTVTIGSILTLFVVMQMTGRIRWAEKFGEGPKSARPDLTSLA